MESEDKLNELVKFQVRRNITNLFKEFLVIIEEIQYDYNISDAVYQKARKKVLDDSNSKIRELEEIIDKLSINLK